MTTQSLIDAAHAVVLDHRRAGSGKSYMHPCRNVRSLLDALDDLPHDAVIVSRSLLMEAADILEWQIGIDGARTLKGRVFHHNATHMARRLREAAGDIRDET